MKTYSFPIAVLEQAAASRPAGYLETVLAAGAVAGEGAGRVVTLTEDVYASLLRQYSGKTLTEVLADKLGATPTAGGPGTELTKLLGRFGVVEKPGCKCKSTAAKMNRWGCDECAKPERVEEVLAVMRAEAANRGLPFLDTIGRMLIRRAIANARRAS
jgi:hypothetical protein